MTDLAAVITSRRVSAGFAGTWAESVPHSAKTLSAAAMHFDLMLSPMSLLRFQIEVLRDCSELSIPIQSRFGNDAVSRSAPGISPVREWMQRHRPAEIGANPSVHGWQREAREPHRMHRSALRENRVLFFDRQKIEQLRTRHVINIEIDSLLSQQRQRLLDESVCYARFLKHDRAFTLSVRRKQLVHAVHRLRGLCKAERLSVRHSFGRTADERCDDRRRAAKCGGHQRPELLRLPWCESDHRAAREILLEKLQRLRISVRWSILAGFEPCMSAHDDERTIRSLIDRLPRLIADCVQSRRDVSERRDERRV